MTLDLTTVVALTALVVNVSGILFVVETLLRRDDGAGRLWAVGFLGAMTTTIVYLAWAVVPDAWWFVSVGNTAFVSGVGFMWLGCVRFNERSLRVPAIVVTVATFGAFVITLLAGPVEGGWGGAPWVFGSLVVLGIAGGIECFRGALGAARSAWALGIILATQALFFIGRLIVTMTVGIDSEVFEQWFGTIPASILTIVMVIVSLVVASVLRAARTPLRGSLQLAASDAPSSDFLTETAFRATVGRMLARSRTREESVGVVSVRVEDLSQIMTAFGAEAGRIVIDAWRGAVRRSSPTAAFVGEDGPDGLVVSIVTESAIDARRQAAEIYRGVFDALRGLEGGVLPVIGVGVALSDVSGEDVDALLRSARDAAHRAASSVESSVVVSDAP